MVKKTQIRFVAVATVILFLAFLAVFFAAWAINGSALRQTINNSLEKVQSLYENDQTDELPENAAIIEITAGGNVSLKGGDEMVFTQQIRQTIADAASGEERTENAGDFYFRTDRQGANRIVYVVDASFESGLFRSALLKILVLLISVFAVLFILVLCLSVKVFDPIRRILAKQKQFISDASHELKTPVSIISANADVIRTEKNGAYADSIKKQVERLKFLVGDMLTLARLDEGKIQTVSEKFNLSDEITQTALSFDAVAFEKGKTLNCDIEKNVFYDGDRHGVKQILNILLDNAVKYAADGGNITVSLKKTGAKIRLSVYNDGSLIPERDSQKIFERFYRGDDSRSRESGGNGLGLSIAKNIAVANKWQIDAESVYGKSMKIVLTL